jgi:signal transduction histidine kinase
LRHQVDCRFRSNAGGTAGRKNNVGLDIRIEGFHTTFWADERKILHILVNHLTNAIKFTLPGGQVTLCAWCRPDTDVGFEISDTGTGIGIAARDIPKALSAFGQVDSDLNRKYDGTGLGLPLTKALVELHGGTFELRSEPGAGTTVTVRLPDWRMPPLAARQV